MPSFARHIHNLLLARPLLSSICNSLSLGGKTVARGFARPQPRGLSSKKASAGRFWLLLTENLQQRHHTLPTHTIEEMRLLHARFPQNIQLFIARQTATLLAGAVVYDYGATVHTQYLATSKLGRQRHALDALLHKLITERYAHRGYFDFGKSTEREGRYLNTNLIYQRKVLADERSAATPMNGHYEH